ncbi:hypothetical protein Aca07nite_76540 [Actinoplanes capillaceus]|uniref:HTH cro/C1-type domain-containing protein n=1 Tax=Actinoplanes campanulatus TaxID=113559 RepID=A0ABQ3WVU3_9ACTN|nr:hypothetical protein Aca07nite_76540 [Actinoplanes capillaceus]
MLTDAQRSTLSALLRRLNLFLQPERFSWLLAWNIHLSHERSLPARRPPSDLAAYLADPALGVSELVLDTLRMAPRSRGRRAVGTAATDSLTATQSTRSHDPAYELPLGRKIAYWRGRRKMSQQVFADRMGKSKSWVDKVERGVRRIDKFSVIYDIADVLQVDVLLLLGRDAVPMAEPSNCLSQVHIEEIRAALERYDHMSAFFQKSPSSPSLPDLRQAVSQAWQTYQHAKYGMLARALPKLLQDGQTADSAHANSPHAQAAANLLGQIYQIASSVLRKVGEHELSWFAADRAIAVSQRSRDHLLATLTSNQLLIGTAALTAPQHPLKVGRFQTVIDLSRISTSQRPSSGSSEHNGLEPSEIRVRPLAHEVLSDVLRRTRAAPPAPIEELAEQMGVGV